MSHERIKMTVLFGLFAFSIILSLSHKGLAKKEAQLGLVSAVNTSKGIALLELKGPISFSQEGQFLSQFTAESVLSELDTITEDKRVKGVLIRINSPGGTVGASQELYQAIKAFKKKTSMPVVASIADVGASGAYYTAMAADTIFANPGSLVGSIGVIMTNVNLEKLAEKFGVDVTVFKSGQYKDLLSSFRTSTDEEKQLVQALIDDVHQQFLNDFIKARKLSMEQAQRLADGRIFTGQQAYKEGLVDHLAGLNEAIMYTAKKAGIQGKPIIIKKSKVHFGNWLAMLQSQIKGMFLSFIPATGTNLSL